MRKLLFARAMALVLCISAMLGSLCFTACSSKETPLLSLEGQSISVNHYELLLSREKAQNAGFSSWSQVADLTSGITYDELARKAVLDNAKKILAALVLFEQEGLTLPDSTYDEIDQNIADMKTADANGSKSEFNRVLSAYGVNESILREIYIKEAKYEYVKEYLYGEANISDTVRQQFVNSNVVAFKQILVRTYDYKYETDDNGDHIYYIKNENNAKVNNIAYDTVNGVPHQEETTDGGLSTVTDKNGDTVYFVSVDSDRIAYDKVSGVRAMVTDTSGNPTIETYDQAKKTETKTNTVEPLMGKLTPNNYSIFENEMNAYYKSVPTDFAASTDLSFIFTMENHYAGQSGADMFNDMAASLQSMNVGDICLVESEAGFHIIMKYDVPGDAATNTKYESWFGDLDETITNHLFTTRCNQFFDAITVNEELWKTTPSMTAVNDNYYY